MTESSESMELVARIERAAQVLEGIALRTPLAHMSTLSRQLNATVFLKSEHLQKTGSFKVRGATAKIAALADEGNTRPVITASSGNHGLGVAYALARSGRSGVICVPEGASTAKIEAIQELGASVKVVGKEAGETEALTRTHALTENLEYISPYNDLDVIAGQGTVGLEIADQVGSEGVDVVVVSVGGGGLASGVAAAVKSRFPDAIIVGASPANDAAMAASVAAGRIIASPSKPTLSDGTAGGIEAGAITFELCRELIDEWVLVEEEEIRDALKIVINTHHQLVEGAAAVAVAAAIKAGPRLADKRVVIVSCGGNISALSLRDALN